MKLGGSALALALALLGPGQDAAAEPASGWARAGFSVYIQYGLESGSTLDARDVQVGLVYDARWIELRLAPVAGTSFSDIPADVLVTELNGWRPRVGIAGPWRLAPFIEFGSDGLDSAETHGSGGNDPSDSDIAIGLRWKVDQHWTLHLYHREYDFHDVDRTAPLPQLERLEATTTGLALSWQF